MGKYDSILDLYDTAEDKEKQILSLCKLYKIPMADLKKIITDSLNVNLPAHHCAVYRAKVLR